MKSKIFFPNSPILLNLLELGNCVYETENWVLLQIAADYESLKFSLAVLFFTRNIHMAIYERKL